MPETQSPRVTRKAGFCIVTDEQGQSAPFPAYEHTPLPPGRTIRLLKLERPTQPWPLSQLSEMNEFSLLPYRLDATDFAALDGSRPPYVAMSYSWGDPVFDTPLVVVANGRRTVLPVTATAWEAVQRALPAIGGAGYLMWVDQICIDQRDTREKDQQVALMGEIYRRCWHCMIWLGAADDGTETAFRLLNKLQEAFPHDQPMPMDQRQVADLSHAQIRAELAAKVGRDVLPESTDPGWIEVARLLQDRTWFTRLWTFQEAVLCYKGDASVRCGIHNISLITLMRAAILLGFEYGFVGFDYTVGRARLLEISSFRYHVEHGNLTPLVWLVQTGAFRNCYDPRDRVYALLGLCKEDGPEYAVQVDYERSARDLYIDIARKVIRSKGSLRICAESTERMLGTGIADLPSWVPDWTWQPLVSTFELMNPSASYFTASNGRAHNDTAGDPSILTTEGRVVDSILSIIDIEVPAAVDQERRRIALVDRVIPCLLRALKSKSPGLDNATMAYTIVNTLTVGGYTRTNNIGGSGLSSEAWSKAICSQMLPFILDPTHAMPQPSIDPELWMHALTRECLHCTNRKFAVGNNNLLLLVPKASFVGDSIATLHGSSLPFVLRSVENPLYTLIGPCYVDGIMHGESVNWTTGEVIRIC